MRYQNAILAFIVLITLGLTQPTLAQLINVINVPPDPAPLSIGSYTELNLLEGGMLLGDFRAGETDGSSIVIELNIDGGTTNYPIDFYGNNTLNITNGHVSDQILGQYDSTINFSGGFVESFWLQDRTTLNQTSDSSTDIVNIRDNSTWNLHDGYIERESYVGFGSTLNMHGGFFDGSLRVNENSVAYIYDGHIDRDLSVSEESIAYIMGGTFGPSMLVSTSELNLSAGDIDYGLRIYNSTMNMSGGTVGTGLDAKFDSIINISGGSFGDFLRVRDGSQINITGGDFRIDGVLIDGLGTIGSTLAYDIPDDALLSGILADGTPFAISSQDSDSIDNGALTLTRTELPVIGPPVISLPGDSRPLGIRAGQTLTVENGGILGNHFNAGLGSTTNILGGQIGEHFEAVGALVSISGGTIGRKFSAHNGSIINISDGNFENSFRAHNGSTVNISGGSLGSNFNANKGSTVNISGGSFGSTFRAYETSTVNISGGTFGDTFLAYTGSSLNLSGAEFRVNGDLIPGLQTPGNSISLNLPVDAILSGTLADGSTVIFSNHNSKKIADGTLTLTAENLPPVSPPNIVLPTDTKPSGLRDGQTLTINEGGILGDEFNASWGSTVMLSGGTIGDNFEAVGADITILSGTIGSHFRAYTGSTVNLSGGTIGNSLGVYQGSSLYVSGDPTIGSFSAYENSQVVFSEGTVAGNFFAREGSTVSISGGSIHKITSWSDHFTISGGSINSSLSASNGTVTISGSAVVNSISNSSNSVINIAGGTVSGISEIRSNCQIHVSGGLVEGDLKVGFQGFLDISGGTISDTVEMKSNSHANISGGIFENEFNALPYSDTNIFGSEFWLGGIDITPSLITNSPITITDRDVTLSGIFPDGSAFSFDLNSTNTLGFDYFDPSANLTITLIVPGDFNASTDVEGTDFLRWQRGLANPYDPTDLENWEANFGHYSDFDNDGDTDGLDFLTWQRGFGETYNTGNYLDWENDFGNTTPAIAAAAAIPEPATSTLLLLASLPLLTRRHRR